MATKRTRTANLYERDGWYYVLRQLNGKQVWKSLRMPVADDRSTYPQAKIAAAHTLADLAVYHLHGGREREQAARPYSTLAEMHAVYKQANAGRSDISPRSATRALATLKLICTEVLGEHDPKRVRCDAVTVKLFRQFESARIVAVRDDAERRKLHKQEAELLESKAQNTIRSAAAKFKSIFQPLMMEAYEEAGLRLPEEAISKIMRMRVAGSFHRPGTVLKPEIRAAIVAKIAATRDTDPGFHLALSLAWETGLRRDTMIHTRWDWFTATADYIGIRFMVTKTFSYSIRVPTDLGAQWQALAGDRQYVLPGDTPQERDQHVVCVIKFLREIGVTDEVETPYHELRKWHGQYFAEEHGGEESDLRLGHKLQGVGAKSYYHLESKIVDRMGVSTKKHPKA